MSEIEVNGNKYDESTIQEVESLFDSPVFNRSFGETSQTSGSESIIQESDLRSRLGKQYSGDRDTYTVLGYDKSPDFEDYEQRYERQDIARRIIELPPKDTWRKPPEIESDNEQFVEQFEALVDSTLLYHYLKRWDIVSGIGQYGLLFVGYADGQPIEEEVNAGALASLDASEAVQFLTPFTQDDVEGWKLGKEQGLDASDPRYNKPVTYYIDFGEVDGDSRDDDIKEVHHTRVQHFAEGATTSDLKGTPRLKPVLNRLFDREKVVGASAEMFWSGADRKLVFNVDPEKVASVPEDRLAKLSEDAQKLTHDMQQHMNTYGTDVQVIGGETPNPEGVVKVIDQSIAGATGIPQNKLVGNEMGERSTTQDRKNWFDNIGSRQETTAGPQMQRPLMMDFIEFNVLPDAEFSIEFPSLFELNEVEESEVQQNRAKAAKDIAPNGNTDLLRGGLDGAIEYLQTGEFPEDDMAGNEFDPIANVTNE